MKKQNVAGFWTGIIISLIAICYLVIETMVVDSSGIGFAGDPFLIGLFMLSICGGVFISSGVASVLRKHSYNLSDIKDGAVLQLEMFRWSSGQGWFNGVAVIDGVQYIVEIHSNELASREAVKEGAKFFKKGKLLYEMK